MCTVSVQSVSQSCPALCDSMDYSTPRFPVHRQLPQHAQTHVHRVGVAIHPSHILCHPLLLCLQSFPASRSFPRSQLFASGGQSIGVSASASALLMNMQDLFPLGLTGLTSLLSKGLSRDFSNTTVQRVNFSEFLFLYGPTLTSIHDYWKNRSFDLMGHCWKAMFLFFNMLSMFVIAFLPRSKHLLISRHKINLNKLKRTENISSIFSEHNYMKGKINHTHTHTKLHGD